MYAVFGVPNPFYVVASESMVPELEVYDVLVVQGNIPFDQLGIGDIIVFDRPSDHNRVIVHRIVSIVDEDPRTVRTKGDANRMSIPGTDFPVTDAEYIGKVEIVIPQVGYVTQALKPPVNYIIIAIIIGAMISKQLLARRGGGEEPAGDDTATPETGGGGGPEHGEAQGSPEEPARDNLEYDAGPDKAVDDSAYVTTDSRDYDDVGSGDGDGDKDGDDKDPAAAPGSGDERAGDENGGGGGGSESEKDRQGT